MKKFNAIFDKIENVIISLCAILLVGIIVAVLAFGYAVSFIDDVYAAEVRLYVNNTYGAGTIGFSSSQMTAAQSLATTYMVVLDTYDVLEEVAQVAVNEYGASKTYSVAQLRSMITTAAIDETEVFKVEPRNVSRAWNRNKSMLEMFWHVYERLQRMP